MKFNPETKSCDDLKLCDFGLSIKFVEKIALTDFCGSPGFFAPEMITKGSYFGHKADIWSIGCILLELILGHERFCDVWMTAYDYEILQEKEKFTEAIMNAVSTLPDALTFSPELNDFVLKFLTLKSSERPLISSLLAHPWLVEFIEMSANRMRFGSDPDISIDVDHTRSYSSESISSTSPSGTLSFRELREICGSPEAVKDSAEENLHRAEFIKESISVRERKMLEDYNSHHVNVTDSVYHLPPIEPATPSLGKARKILQKGHSLAESAEHGFVDGFDSPLLSVKKLSIVPEQGAKDDDAAHISNFASGGESY